MIKKIVSNTPADVMRFELFLSDYCNYQCWYCSTDFNGKTVKWPNLDTLLPNFLHLLDYYKSNGKKRFIIHIGGGEPTLWPGLVEFISEINKHCECKISLTTNGSRTLRWWEENVNHFSHVGLSVHHEKVDPKHIANVGDIIYKNKVGVWSSVLMDPNQWDKCINIINTLKESKYSWSVSADLIYSDNITYTDEQKKFLNKRYHRNNSFFNEIFVQKSNRPKYYNPTVHFIDGSANTVPNHWLLLNGHNKFTGWRCNVGVETAFINKQGDIKGSCGNKLYNENFYYNIYDEDFKIKFKPTIAPVICEMPTCSCQPEVNCTKIDEVFN